MLFWLYGITLTAITNFLECILIVPEHENFCKSQTRCDKWYSYCAIKCAKCQSNDQSIRPIRNVTLSKQPEKIFGFSSYEEK